MSKKRYLDNHQLSDIRKRAKQIRELGFDLYEAVWMAYEGYYING